MFDPSSEDMRSNEILQLMIFCGTKESYNNILNCYQYPTKLPWHLYIIIFDEQMHQIQEIALDKNRLS
jgi:hypothetical protein